MSLETRLRRMVPQAMNTFPKLTGGGPPYRFAGWDHDPGGRAVLRYRFPRRDGAGVHQKRVWAGEIEAALRRLADRGTFGRDTFDTACPRTAMDGPCGFAVIGRALEGFGVAVYQGRGQGFRCTNPSRARDFLGS